MFLSSGWLLLLYPAVVSCVGVFLNHCAEGDKAAPTLLPDDIKIHPPYKVTAVFTDWMANTTMVIDEMRFENSKMVETTSRNNASKWITMKDQRVIFSNDTGCSLVNKSTLFTLPDEFKDLGQHEVTSLSGLVDSILANKISGFKSFVRVVAGVEGVGWIRCINNTNSSSVVSVEVVYAGDDSFNPPSPSFKNPVILSLAYSHYSNGSDINSTMLYRVSLDFSPFRKPLDAESQFEIAHGMACKDMNRTEMDIKFPRQFEVMYTKQNSSSLLTSKLMYDSDRNMTAESVIDGVALLFNKSFTKEKYLVVRAKEKEYVFSSSPVCSYGHFSTGGNVSSNEFPPAIDLFIPQFSTLNFSLYSNISEDAMNVHIVEYRAQWGDKVIEIVLHNYTLSTVSIYAKERVLESIGSLTIKELKPNFEDSIDLDSLLRECFNREVNNLFSFVLKGVSSTNSWREDVVSNKLATALTSIPNATISPYRLSFFYIGKEDKYMINDDLRVVMRVADERGTAAEMSSSDFVTLLNSTLPGGISIPVSDTQAWKATEPLEGYPPVSPVVPPSFSGYTGGSMLVMGLFMVMLGVVLGAGGVYLAFRRQRISTLAYQVFE